MCLYVDDPDECSCEGESAETCAYCRSLWHWCDDNSTSQLDVSGEVWQSSDMPLSDTHARLTENGTFYDIHRFYLGKYICERGKLHSSLDVNQSQAYLKEQIPNVQSPL